MARDDAGNCRAGKPLTMVGDERIMENSVLELENEKS